MLKPIVTAFLLLTFAAVVQAKDAVPKHDHESHAAPASDDFSKESLFHSESQWVDADGKQTKLSDLKGKVSLVSMLYTSCTTACPMIVSEMKSLAAEVEKGNAKGEPSKIRMVAFSFDEKKDSPAALRAFKSKMKLGSEWLLLSPTRASDSAEVAALLGVRFKKLPDGHYAHSNAFFLMNEKGEVIAKRDGLNSDRSELIAAMKRAAK